MSRIIRIGGGIVSFMLLISVATFSQDLNHKLAQAAMQGDATAVETLLAKGTDVNARGKYGRTALIYAAGRGHTEMRI